LLAKQSTTFSKNNDEIRQQVQLTKIWRTGWFDAIQSAWNIRNEYSEQSDSSPPMRVMMNSIFIFKQDFCRKAAKLQLIQKWTHT